MTKKRNKNRKNRSVETVPELTFEQAKTWLYDQAENGRFQSSVRIMAKHFGWGMTRVAHFIRELEQAGLLIRTMATGGGKTTFEMFPAEDFSADYQNKHTLKDGHLGIDIEKIWQGDIHLSGEQLSTLESLYEQEMTSGDSGLQLEQLDMIESILKRQLKLQLQPRQRESAEKNPKIFKDGLWGAIGDIAASLARTQRAGG